MNVNPTDHSVYIDQPNVYNLAVLLPELSEGQLKMLENYMAEENRQAFNRGSVWATEYLTTQRLKALQKQGAEL